MRSKTGPKFTFPMKKRYAGLKIVEHYSRQWPYIQWPIRKSFKCILQGVRLLLANHTLLSPTSENDSYQLWISMQIAFFFLAFMPKLQFQCIFFFSMVSSRLHRQLLRKRSPRRSKTKMKMALLEVVIIIDNLDNLDNNLDIDNDLQFIKNVKQ